MPNKDRPLVDRYAPKSGVGWLVNSQQGKVCSFTNDSPTAHAKWVILETRPLRGGGQPVIRKCSGTTQSNPWKRCRKQVGGSVVSPGGDATVANITGSFDAGHRVRR